MGIWARRNERRRLRLRDRKCCFRSTYHRYEKYPRLGSNQQPSASEADALSNCATGTECVVSTLFVIIAVGLATSRSCTGWKSVNMQSQLAKHRVHDFCAGHIGIGETFLAAFVEKRQFFVVHAQLVEDCRV